jgi:catechol 2,3-dioxygenase-like lactoylglutathione lyase family enzyme
MLDQSPLYANVPVKDFERAKRWYQEKLGLSPSMDMGGDSGAIYSPGGVTFLLYKTEFAGTGKHTIGTFVVSDIDQEMTDLRARGVVFEDYAMGDKGPNTVNGVDRDASGMAAAWFQDSEDNILALTQLPPGMEMPKAGG